MGEGEKGFKKTRRVVASGRGNRAKGQGGRKEEIEETRDEGSQGGKKERRGGEKSVWGAW